MIGILQREYGISRQESLWSYSYEEIQQLISEIPFDRIVRTYGNETKADLERKWLESIADFDDTQIVKDKDFYDRRVKIMKLKTDINKETNLTKKQSLEKQLERLTGD